MTIQPTLSHCPFTPKRRVLTPFEGGEAVLSYYPAGHQMAAHSHGTDQRSIVLSGGLAEDTPSRSALAGPFSVGFKAAGLCHENRYGPNGALILAFNTPAEVRTRPWGWASQSSAQAIRALAGGLIAGQSDAVGLVEDLFALMDEEAGQAVSDPSWLDPVREAVLDDPESADVAQLAQRAGVHRASLSRAYQRRFGIPISLERRRAQLSRAIQMMLEDEESAAMAAMGGGFSDQPHFSKVMRSELGITPRVLKAALR